MKIRNGFVSNSSSSSFIVLLPDNFLNKVDYDKITQGDDDFPKEDFKRLLEDFVVQDGIWNEGIYDYDNDGWEFADILYDLMQPYIIGSVDGGPDEGQWSVANKEKVREILNKV